MGTILVYRVEGPDRKGPYQSEHESDQAYGILTECMLSETAEEDIHPTPQEEGLILTDELVCGLLSLDAVGRWFGSALPRLFRLGYAVYGYRVDAAKVQYGKYQVLFDPADAVQRVRF